MQSADVAIPKETALKLCAEIRNQYRGKWWTFAGLQCWGCTTFTKSDPEKMCIAGREGYRGCSLVNARFANCETAECEDA